MENKGCYCHFEAQSTVVAFPSFLIYPSVQHKIEVIVKPLPNFNGPLDFNELITEKINANQPSGVRHRTSTMELIASSKQSYIANTNHHPELYHKLHTKQLTSSATPITLVPGYRDRFQLCSQETITLSPHSTTTLSTGIAIKIPPNTKLHIDVPTHLKRKGIDIIQLNINKHFELDALVTLQNTSNESHSINIGTSITHIQCHTSTGELLQIAPSKIPPHVPTTNLQDRFTTVPLSNNKIMIIDTKIPLRSKI